MKQTEYQPRWDDAPRKRDSVSRLIIKVPPGPPKDYVILSSRVTGAWTHYLDGRTVPCMEADGGCVFDHEMTSLRWQGWIAVQSLYSRAIGGWVCITEAAFHACPLLWMKEVSLRGRSCRLGRAGPKHNSLMVCQLDPFKVDQRILTKEPDAKSFLLALWGSLDRFRAAAGPRQRPGPDVESPIFDASAEGGVK
jgi:hypothetical protein